MRFNSYEFLLFFAMLFRAQSGSDIVEMTTRMVTFAPGRGVDVGWFLLMAGLAGVHALCFWFYKEDLLQRLGWPGRAALVTATVVAIAALGATSRPFIYFQF